MERFLSCDWGTSAFRLRLVETKGLSITAEESSSEGIAGTFKRWEQSGRNEEERFDFYLNIIRGHIQALQDKVKVSLKGTPLVISGMASSAGGMIELPYAAVPSAADGSDFIVKTIEESGSFRHPIHIISGVRTADDAMRGEETQLAGCFQAPDEHPGEQLFIIPGTHSKHIAVKEGRITGFKTYLTGEFFSLLSEKSILAASVEKDELLPRRLKLESFEKGVKESLRQNLLHHAFLARTNTLFNQYTRQENYYYLSGLLIGNELKDLLENRPSSLSLVSSAALAPYYTSALGVLGLPLFKVVAIDEALIKGQFEICIKREK